MQIKILEQIPLGSVPSASGIVVCGDFRYAIGDDSPFLHELDANLKPLRQFRLMDSEAVVGGRIRKSQKADLEAMELINGNEIVIFGSGSRSPQRDVFIQVNLNAELDRKHYHIGTFYDHLRSLPIMEGSGVNIEAAAFHDGNMLLFNRRSPVIFEFNFEEFIHYLERNGSMPQVDACEIRLPSINGVASGFSGATASILMGRLIVTTSVEDTDNAYDDGCVLGSFVGWVPIAERSRSENYVFVQIESGQHALKVESVAVEHEHSEDEMTVLMTTDSDGGTSVALRCLLRWSAI